MPMKRPSFQFYPGDWLHETGLHACSLAARRTLERPTLPTKVHIGEEGWWLMQQFIRLVNWGRFQHYKDRNPGIVGQRGIDTMADEARLSTALPRHGKTLTLLQRLPSPELFNLAKESHGED